MSDDYYESPEEEFFRLAGQLGYVIEEPEDPNITQLRSEIHDMRSALAAAHQEAVEEQWLEAVAAKLEKTPGLTERQLEWVLDRAFNIPVAEDGLLDVDTAIREFRDITGPEEVGLESSSWLPALDASHRDRVDAIKAEVQARDSQARATGSEPGDEYDLDRASDRVAWAKDQIAEMEHEG